VFVFERLLTFSYSALFSLSFLAINQSMNADIDDNQLSGSLPPQYGLLTNIAFFRAHNNSLTGTIPSEFGALTALRSFSLQDNALSGPIPGSLTAPLQVGGHFLTTFRIDNNNGLCTIGNASRAVSDENDD
jgi:hypothetical protein